MKPILPLFVVEMLVIVTYLLTASPAWACYAIVAGRNATSDGAVLLAHAEQNRSPRILNFRRVPPLKHAAGEQFALARDGRTPQVAETSGYLWSELPGTEFSDNLLNDSGVAVVSDSCQSREDDYAALVHRGDIRSGGVGGMLRRLIAQRAHSAREGVTLAGEMIERFGYVDSGRTYVIADPREAWLLAVVRGRHWVARRVPDDQVVVLSNVFVVDAVDLGDSANFLGSRDVVEYAVSRGWYHPDKDGPFRFDRDYGANRGAADRRRWRGQQLVGDREIRWPPASQSFAMKPSEKLTVASVARMLRFVTPYDHVGGFSTQEGAVFQLRRGLPPEIGCVYWRTSGEPNMNVLLPWYLGVRETPANYYRATDLKEALLLDHHFRPAAEVFVPDRQLAWWRQQALQDTVCNDPSARLPAVEKVWEKLEKQAFDRQAETERAALREWQHDHAAARDLLTKYCAGLAAEADREAARMVGALGK
jgi:dipeptidase